MQAWEQLENWRSSGKGIGDQPCGHNLQGYCDDSWHQEQDITTVQLRVAAALWRAGTPAVQPWQSPSSSLQLFVWLYVQHGGRRVSYCNLSESMLSILHSRYQAPLHQFHFISFTKHGMHLPVNWTLTLNSPSNIQFVVYVQTLLSETVPWLAIGRISYFHLSTTSLLIYSLVITKRGCTPVHLKQDKIYCSTQVSLYQQYIV